MKMPPPSEANGEGTVSIDDYSTWRAVRFAERDERRLREPRENAGFFYVTEWPLNDFCHGLTRGGCNIRKSSQCGEAAFLYVPHSAVVIRR